MTNTNRIELPATVEAAHALAVNGEAHPRSYRCDDYASGQCACEICAPARWAQLRAECDARNAATADHRAWVATMTGAILALSNVGRAIAAALSPGLGVGAFVAGSIRAFYAVEGNLVGRWFVVDRRQTAASKANYERVGRCVWQGERTAPPPNRHWERARTTHRLALDFGNGERVYLNCSQVSAVRPPAAVEAAEIRERVVATATRDLREKVVVHFAYVRVGRKSRKVGPTVYVVEGRHAGASGECFWIGPDKATGEADARLGIRVDGQADPLWVSAYECSLEPARLAADAPDAELAAADMALEGRPDAARAAWRSRREIAR